MPQHQNHKDFDGGLHGSGTHIATKHDLLELEKRITHLMATYQEALKAFIAQQTAFNDQMSAGIDAASTSLTAISGDIKNLNDQIAALQNSSGTVTPEDQLIIDAAQAAGQALQAKLTAFDDAISALDALTPPVPPPTAPTK